MLGIGTGFSPLTCLQCVTLEESLSLLICNRRIVSARHSPEPARVSQAANTLTTHKPGPRCSRLSAALASSPGSDRKLVRTDSSASHLSQTLLHAQSPLVHRLRLHCQCWEQATSMMRAVHWPEVTRLLGFEPRSWTGFSPSAAHPVLPAVARVSTAQLWRW